MRYWPGAAKTIWYSESDLVALKAAPSKDAKKHLATLRTNMTQWGQAGQVPITFGQLFSGTHPEHLQAAFQLTREVAGEQIWTRFFDDRDVTTEHYVPFQPSTILNIVLTRAQPLLEKYCAEHDFTENAKKKFLEIMECDAEAKRQRSGPYSPY